MNKKIYFLFFLFFQFSSVAFCAESPSWYSKPKQNTSEKLYGVAEGYTLEEATKYALVDVAAKLVVSISSESNMIREENQNSVNEEMRQQVKQSVEKINFTNFKVSRSEQIGQKFFVEVEIEKDEFISQQKEQISFLESQVNNLEKNLSTKNPIQRRVSLLKMIESQKQVVLLGRIITGAGEKFSLKEKLAKLSELENQLNLSSDKIEFYFSPNSPKEIVQIVRNALNKNNLKIAKSQNSSQNQITIEIDLNSKTSQIYGANITKLNISFQNLSGKNIVASNSIEVSGSSTISEKDSYLSAIKTLEEKISEKGVLQILGILN
jgi:hypothetical protein